MIVEVPVFINSDPTQPPIGTLKVDRGALPAQPNFCFALMYSGSSENNEWELKAVFLSDDESYKTYLDSLKS